MVADSSTARMYGIDYCKKYEVERFSISKQMIFSENDIRSVCNTRKISMYGNDENEHSEDDFSGYDGLAVSQSNFLC